MQPLSHHEILGWVAPFSQAGHAADLPASQRQLRQLQFKPRPHDLPGLPGLQETLLLENAEPGRFRLQRTLTFSGPLGQGLAARLQAEGPDPAALLARLAAVPLARQWIVGPGFAVALQQQLASDAAQPVLLLDLARGRLDGLRFQLTMPRARGSLAEFDMAATGSNPIALPEDLLAVLGYGWARLEPRDTGWRSHLRLRGSPAQLSARAEAELARAMAHLAQTLAEPPARFHARHRWARWRVTGRRAVPMAASLGLIAGAFLVPRVTLDQESVLRMLILNAPPLLLIGFFCLRETPRIEIPPLPRPLTAPAWFPAGAVAVAEAVAHPQQQTA